MHARRQNHPLSLLWFLAIFLVATSTTISDVYASQGQTGTKERSSRNFSTKSTWGVVMDKANTYMEAGEKVLNRNLITRRNSETDDVDMDIVMMTSEGKIDSETNNFVIDNKEKEYQDKKKPLRVIVMGGPASGKGTQSQRLADEYNLVHLSTGDMLRDAVKQRVPVGLIAKEYMDQGKLVPDDVIIRIVMERLSETDCQEQGWLLDGFPRTHRQAKAMINFGIEVDKFLLLNVSDDIMIERVVGRRIDPETKKVYHMTYNPPPSSDEAIVNRLIQRSDDTIEKMRHRLQNFHTNLNDIRQYFEHKLVEIEGSQPPNIVFESIRKIFDDHCEVIAS